MSYYNTTGDPFQALLEQMPGRDEDPARQAMFTELIKLRTKTLELQIAEARRKEKEAELELERLKRGGPGPSSQLQTQTPSQPQSQLHTLQPPQAGQNYFQTNLPPVPSTDYHHNSTPSLPTEQSSSGLTDLFNGYSTYGAPANDHDGSSMGLNNSLTLDNDGNATGLQVGSTMMNPFDLEAMQASSMEDWFNIFPNAMDSLDTQLNNSNPNPSPFFPQYTHESPATQLKLEPAPTPSRTKRSPSPSSSTTSTPPPAKRVKKIEKKLTIEQQILCATCATPITRVILRAVKSHLPDELVITLRCTRCAPIKIMTSLPDLAGKDGAVMGTVDVRKRLRISMESEDEDHRLADRRIFCDVCQRATGSGRIVDKDQERLNHMSELVCLSCDRKYQRCTDCGGGGGARLGIGKWRMKQVFPPGRKTCSLSHNRLGDRIREIGVHVTPTDFSSQQLKEVLMRCKGLWNEKTLARLAVPEMLEIDLPPNLINPLKEFSDVEDIITRNWTTREAMITAAGADPGRFKRLLGLTWAHSKPRRTKGTVDIEEEYAKNVEHDIEEDMSTVLANVKKTNIVIPAGSDLVGMWGGEWDMKHGSLLISTLIPFEGTDGEDSTALSVGEMITKVQDLQHEMNAERRRSAAMTGNPVDLIPACEHLWVVSGGTMPLVRERVADILVRKRSFVHVEEYLTRHPDFIHALKARPYGLHPDYHGQQAASPNPLVLVRWLGKDFNAEKILEIKQQEFGGKARSKKRTKSKV